MPWDRRHTAAKSVKKPTILDIAWAAGIYEGEGTSAAKGGNRCSERVVVNQKDPWLCAHLKELFGGSTYHYVRSQRGRKNLEPINTWTINGPRAKGFLLTIYSFLSPRRRLQVRKTLGV